MTFVVVYLGVCVPAHMLCTKVQYVIGNVLAVKFDQNVRKTNEPELLELATLRPTGF